MGLRRRGYLGEANYDRDREVRDTAMGFFRDLTKFIKKRAASMIPRSDGGYAVHAQEFWRNNRAGNFGVVFVPKRPGVTGGIGHAGRLPIMLLPILKSPHDLSHIDTRLSNAKDVVVHEMAHYLDAKFRKTKKIKRYRVGDDGAIDPKAYYNDPSEWNAFWHEGARQWEDMFQWRLFGDERVRGLYLGDGSLKQARERVDKFWDKAFLDHMTSKTRRKFDKRFAQLWSAAKKKGLL